MNQSISGVSLHNQMDRVILNWFFSTRKNRKKWLGEVPTFLSSIVFLVTAWQILNRLKICHHLISMLGKAVLLHFCLL